MAVVAGTHGLHYFENDGMGHVRHGRQEKTDRCEDAGNGWHLAGEGCDRQGGVEKCSKLFGGPASN